MLQNRNSVKRLFKIKGRVIVIVKFKLKFLEIVLSIIRMRVDFKKWGC